MPCLSYPEYRAYGGALGEAAFARAEFAARKMIGAATRGRLARDAAPGEAVRRLAFELVERGLLGALDGKNITGASNDGLSVSYENGAAPRPGLPRRRDGRRGRPAVVRGE
jgi:hypothetical protein